MWTELACVTALMVRASVDVASFVPPKPPAQVVNYFCTWYTQNAPVFGGIELGDAKLFGDCSECGWARDFHNDSREDLVFLLDNGWSAAGSSFQLSKQFADELENGGAKNWSKSVSALALRLNGYGWHGLGFWHHDIDATDQRAHHRRAPDLY